MWSAPKIELKSPRELALMRNAGRLLGRVLDEIGMMVRPGVTSRELDELADQRIREAGATALFRGVKNPAARFPFPACICASLNEAVVHGIPDDRPLEAGDVLSVDCGLRLKGYCSDSARTYAVGEVSLEARKLLAVTKEALDIAVREIRPRIKWSAVAEKMQKCVEDAGFGVVREFVGHGIGREMHEEPKIPNYVDRDQRLDFELLPGMTLAIEPMVAAGGPEVDYRDDDRWTVITKDRSLAAHFEHTVAVTTSGAEVLTRAD
ncbi:MAG: type I methionyl aminopeptidase [Phycisphaerae bacterium]|nr:type I methionyl aminopeptidase [Phycisphaerae bacterium]